MPRYAKTQVILSTSRKRSCLFVGKKSTLQPCFSGDIVKIYRLLIMSALSIPDCTHPK